MKTATRTLLGPLLIAGCLIGAAPAHAQDHYPDQHITVVVPFTGGGPSSMIARLLTDELSQELDATIIIENRPGASGGVGTRHVARSKPDGYTLVWGTTGTHGVNPLLYSNLGYDPITDFEPIALAATSANMIAVNPEFPAQSVQELIDMAKKDPGKYDSAAAGIGTSVHMTGELFKQMAGVEINHIQYQGSAQALTDVIAGHVPIVFDVNTSVMQHVKGGQLRPLGVSSAKRLPNAPDVPPIADTLPGFESTVWFGMFAPAGTPQSVVDKLNHAINTVLEKEAIQERFIDYGAVVNISTPEDLRKHLHDEREKWKTVIEDANIKVE